MKIPFLDAAASYRELQNALDEAYRRVANSGRYVLGDEVDLFEREFSQYCGVRHCVSVGNGLDALHLLLRAAGIGSGDEIIVPANTFIATWLAVTYSGARPIPVEPDPCTFNIDAGRIAAAVTSRTRAILAVHLYGQPADMDAVRGVATQYDLRVFEDAAQAHGAKYRGARAGNLCDGAAFSFYPAKNLGALGDGGAVVTNNDDLADRVRLLRNYGSRRKYDHEIVGFNSRLDPVQAAFLRVKLGALDGWNERRRNLAAFYAEQLSRTSEVALPAVPSWAEPVWHLFVIRTSLRAELQRLLTDAGVESMIHYPIPPHLSGAYAGSQWPRGAFPVTESLADTVLSLPMGPHLELTEATQVVSAVKRISQLKTNATAMPALR